MAAIDEKKSFETPASGPSADVTRTASLSGNPERSSTVEPNAKELNEEKELGGVKRSASLSSKPKADEDIGAGETGSDPLAAGAEPTERWLTGKKLLIVHSAMLLSYVCCFTLTRYGTCVYSLSFAFMPTYVEFC